MDWISVKDRLPDPEKEVAVIEAKMGDRFPSIYMGWIDRDSGKWAVVYSDGGLVEDAENNPDYFYITHWYPLPDEFPDIFNKKTKTPSVVMSKNTHDILVCDCSSVEHQIVISYNLEDGTAYCSIHLSSVGFFRRVLNAFKYVFGYKCKYGHFEEFVLSKEHSKKISELGSFLDGIAMSR